MCVLSLLDKDLLMWNLMSWNELFLLVKTLQCFVLHIRDITFSIMTVDIRLGHNLNIEEMFSIRNID